MTEFACLMGIAPMKTLEEIKQWLVQNKSLLQERYSVQELGGLGSYVRQEQTEASDVDVLVEFSETPSLLQFVNLENYLSDNLRSLLEKLRSLKVASDS